MDSALIPKGVKRCPLPQFGAALMILGAVLLSVSYTHLRAHETNHLI